MPVSVLASGHRAAVPTDRTGFGALLVALALLFLNASVHAAPATQPGTPAPASAYENQPIKRNAAAGAAAGSPKSSDNFDWQRLVMAMGIVIGLILVLKYAAGRMFPGMKAGRATRVVRVLSRSPISPRQTVMLLQVGKRVIVVGDSAGELTALAQIDDADEVASLVGQIETTEVTTMPRKPFAALFGRARQEFEPTPEDIAMDSNESTDADPAQGSDEIRSAQTEISGLIDRMRSLTSTLRRDGTRS